MDSKPKQSEIQSNNKYSPLLNDEKSSPKNENGQKEDLVLLDTMTILKDNSVKSEASDGSDSDYLKQEDEDTNARLKYIVFALAGMTTGYTFSLMTAQVDIFDEVFKDMNYSFYSVLPEYFNIPFAILITRLMTKNKLSIMTKFKICICTFTFFFCLIPIMTFAFNPTT